MQGALRSIAVIAAVTALYAAPAAAQGVSFGIGGGVTFSLEDNGGEDIHGTAGIGFGRTTGPFSFFIDGTYQDLGDSDNAFELNNGLIYFTGNLVYKFPTGEATRIRPYLIGGGGYYTNEDFDGGDFGINGGAGAFLPLGSGNIRAFLEGRFHNVFTDGDDLNFIPVTLGLRFGGGN